jgi:soluble lytic murein transglycosylase-like protein
VTRTVLIVLGAAVLGAACPAAAQMFRLTGPDGTVHYTNTPADPQYRRMGMTGTPGTTTGTSAGWLRLPSDWAPYTGEIRAAADRYGVPEKLITSVITVESGFNPRAVSRKGARGLMQLMPETASILGVRNSFDPRENIDGGVRHLRALLERFGNDVSLVLAAYNAGEQAVVIHGGVPPFPETRDYVTRILQIFNAAGGLAPPRSTFRTFERNGSIVYTNIPPRGRL